VSAVVATNREEISIFTNVGAFGENGRAAPTAYPGYRAAPGALGEYNGNSYATIRPARWFLRDNPAFISAAPIAISFNRKNAGSSPASDSHATHNKS